MASIDEWLPTDILDQGMIMATDSGRSEEWGRAAVAVQNSDLDSCGLLGMLHTDSSHSYPHTEPVVGCRLMLTCCPYTATAGDTVRTTIGLPCTFTTTDVGSSDFDSIEPLHSCSGIMAFTIPYTEPMQVDSPAKGPVSWMN